MRDRPEVVLTRHFFTSLFDFGFLSDDGAESLKRALLGSLAVAIALGLLLTRVFMAKYGDALGGTAGRLRARSRRRPRVPHGGSDVDRRRRRAAWWAIRSFPIRPTSAS